MAEKFGVLDILVNNAGVGGEGGILNAHTIQTTEAEMEEVFSTNVFAVVALTRELLPLLKQSSAGRIVNLSSVLGSLTLQASPDMLDLALLNQVLYGARDIFNRRLRVDPVLIIQIDRIQPYRANESVRLPRIKGRGECFHHSFGCRTEGHEDQGELGASWLG